MDDLIVPTLRPLHRDLWTDVGVSGVWVEGVSDPAHLGIHSVFYSADTFAGGPDPGRGTVVFVPGFSESWPRFIEMAWYMLSAGFNALIIENRGHGESLRETEDPESITIHDWHSYVSDTVAVVREARSAYGLEGPMFGLGHSMGGAITAAVLEDEPTLFERAVLSSPMLLARMPLAAPLAWAVSGIAASMGFGDRTIPGMASEFGPAMDEEDKLSATASDTGSNSPNRAIWYRTHRRAKLSRHILNPTWNWLHQSLAMDGHVMRRSSISRITAPTILFGAGDDKLVRSDAEGQFISTARQVGAPVRYHVFPTARHEIFTGTTPVLETYLGATIGLFRGAMRTTPLPSWRSR